MRRVVCTSFSDQGYRQYGRRFLKTYAEHVDLPLWVFHDGVFPEEQGPVYVDTREDADLRSFLRRHKNNAAAHGVVEVAPNKCAINYRYQAVKFARKVYALTSPLRPDCDWWIWVDADVVWNADTSDEFWEAVCPEGFTASYLGRMDWHHSECGFVGYNRRYRGFDFLADLRKLYDTDAIFGFDEWHDSFVWDRLRERYEEAGSSFFNISKDIPGMHVWPQTPLGSVSEHHKGPKAKLEAYA